MDTQTNTHPANVNFDPLWSKSSFLRMDFVHSSSLRFWTRGHMFRAISFEIIKFRDHHFSRPQLFRFITFIEAGDVTRRRRCQNRSEDFRKISKFFTSKFFFDPNLFILA